MVEEVKDSGLPRKDGRSREITKEVLALTNGFPPMKPSAAKKTLQGLKEKRFTKQQA